MEIPEQFLHITRPSRLAERGETRQVDEDDRGILTDGLGKEVRIAGQPLLNIRSLELAEQPAFHRKILRLPPAGPELNGAKKKDRRRYARDRHGRVQPNSR